jgi:hypothetical protein
MSPTSLILVFRYYCTLTWLFVHGKGKFILHCLFSVINSLLKTIMPGIYLCETVNIMHDAKTNKLPEMELTEGLKLNRDEKLCCNRPCTSRC